MAGSLMRREIGEQPEALAATLAGLSEAAEAAAVTIRGRGISTVVTAARGSSHNVARYATYALGIDAGLLVADAAPSIVTAYDAAPPLASTALLAISQSGSSPDLLAVAAAARAAHAPVIAITNSGDAAIGDIADHLLVTPAGTERSVPATKTYTTSLAAVALLAAALAGRVDRDGAGPAAAPRTGLGRDDLARIPDAVKRVLAIEERIAELGGRLREAERCVVLGRGYNRGTAAEIALKIQETSYLSAQDYGASDFLHGPLAVVFPGFEVLAVAAGGPTAGPVLDVCRRARELGGHVTLLTDGAVDAGDSAAASDDHLALDTGLSEQLSPIGFAVAGQLLALHLAESLGLSPDEPRSLSKVTLTR
jgi:glucosamine--fructose-6-phosphate aminotransferase (isomerizing)